MRVLSLSLVVVILGCGQSERVPVEMPVEEVFVEADGDRAINFWHRNGMNGSNFFIEMMGSGAALFDADNDGDLDAYLTQGRPLGEGAEEPESPGGRLFLNSYADTGELGWIDSTEKSGLVATEYGTGVAVADVDNDGDRDLYLSNFGPNQLFLNDGNARFTLIEDASGAADDRWSASAAFFDYDQDGYLDLYVTNYVDFTLDRPKVCSGPSGRPDYCSPNSYRGEPDSLFRNLGPAATPARQFEDVTLESGIARHYGNGLGVVTEDFDQDGLVDLYVANDLEPNIFWRNQGDGTFDNEAMLFGIAVNADGKAEAGMGLVTADFDNDGDQDLFLTHLVGETNTFYENQGGALFLDGTQSKGLALPSVKQTGFGVVAVDFNNDGLLDLAVANGAVTVVEEQVLAGSDLPLVMPNQLFLQTEAGFVESELVRNDDPQVSRGIAAGDVDNDGDSDLLIMNNHGTAQLLLNQVGSKATWVGVELFERFGEILRDAHGASVRLDIGGASGGSESAAPRSLYRRVAVEGGYLASHDPRIIFGLGGRTSASSAPVKMVAEVCWKAGVCESFALEDVGQYHRLVQGEGE